MNRLIRILRYQLFSLNVGEVLAIIVAVVILDTTWSRHPWWPPYLLGFMIGAGEIALQPIMKRWMSRSPSPKPSRPASSTRP